ncbi:CCHC-type domain-containing protein [Trichonephila clavipes]|nr:CCHC-type domain-containing protein [Trichonephila clavipes]
MGDSNAELTAICDTAKSVWEKLLSVYEQSSGQRLDHLMEKFFLSDKEMEDDIVSHIAKLQINFMEGVPESEVWIADSGGSAHMTKHRNYFVDFTQFISPKPVYVGNSDEVTT